MYAIVIGLNSIDEYHESICAKFYAPRSPDSWVPSAIGIDEGVESKDGTGFCSI